MNNKIQKGHNPTATSVVPGAKAGYYALSLHTAPPSGWADHLSHPYGLIHQSLPTLTTFKEPARPPPRMHKGTSYLFSLPRAAAQVPVKSYLNCSSGFLISIDLRVQGPWLLTLPSLFPLGHFPSALGIPYNLYFLFYHNLIILYVKLPLFKSLCGFCPLIGH